MNMSDDFSMCMNGLQDIGQTLRIQRQLLKSAWCFLSSRGECFEEVRAIVETGDHCPWSLRMSECVFSSAIKGDLP